MSYLEGNLDISDEDSHILHLQETRMYPANSAFPPKASRDVHHNIL